MTTTAPSAVRRSPRKAKGHGHLRRAEILEAAERIFIDQGYQGATIRKIAEAVGVSSTALYMHFQDKSQIFLEICERTARVLLELYSEVAARPLPARERIRMMLEAFMRWGLEHPNAYQLVYASVRTESTAPWPGETLALSLQSHELLHGLMAELAADGKLVPSSVDVATQSMWLSCHGVVALLTGRPNYAWPREELIATTLDTLMRGLFRD